MLTKENTKKAEQIRDQLAPLFANASRLADKWEKAAREQRTARDRAFFWLYVGSAGGCPYGDTLPQEEKERAQQLRKDSPKEWHKIRESLFEEEHQAEHKERAYWFNYSNYCRYIGDMIAELIRPYVWELKDKKGLETLGEIISPKAPKDYRAHTLRAYIKHNPPSFGDCLDLIITVSGGGSCGAWFSDYYYFSKVHNWAKDPTEPQPMTAKQYADRVAKLREYEEKAKAIQKEQREKAKAWGLLDAVELLKSPQVEKYR